MKNAAPPSRATPARAPITIPAIAPPESPPLLLELEVGDDAAGEDPLLLLFLSSSSSSSSSLEGRFKSPVVLKQGT